MSSSDSNIVLEMKDGIYFTVGADTFVIGPLSMRIGEWLALVPDGPMPVPNPAGRLSWVLATMEEPAMGTVELLGHDVYKLQYAKRQRLRSKLGYVHGYGGLLSNHTVAENIALPLRIQADLKNADVDRRITQFLKEFSLESVADLRPHEMDGATRWRVCLARALVMNPPFLVLEGLGNWEMYQGRGIGWQRIVGLQSAGRLTSVICLASENPGFENWLENNGGTILRYTKYETSD